MTTDTVTPVTEIRRAAALMRERATAATPSPWDVMQDAVLGQHACQDAPNCWLFVADVDHDDGKGHANQRHIASWHPAVALAIADWLDSDANDLEFAYGDGFDNAYLYDRTLMVARTYLYGEQP